MMCPVEKTAMFIDGSTWLRFFPSFLSREHSRFFLRPFSRDFRRDQPVAFPATPRREVVPRRRQIAFKSIRRRTGIKPSIVTPISLGRKRGRERIAGDRALSLSPPLASFSLRSFLRCPGNGMSRRGGAESTRRAVTITLG